MLVGNGHGHVMLCVVVVVGGWTMDNGFLCVFDGISANGRNIRGAHV